VVGTLVHTSEGVKKIEDVKEGDKVLSYNEQSGQTEYQTVQQTFTRYAQDVLSIKVAGESEPIGVTSEHPFFVRVHGARSDTSNENDGEWRKSGELKVGDEIRTATGDWAKVESVDERSNAQVYNFEVASNHNYFVGQQGLLVHNTCKTNHLKKDGTPSFDKNREEILKGNPDCAWCGLPAERNGVAGHADHIDPKSLGGSDHIDNLQPSCQHCNTSRGNREAPKTLPKDYPSNQPPPPWHK